MRCQREGRLFIILTVSLIASCEINDDAEIYIGVSIISSSNLNTTAQTALRSNDMAVKLERDSLRIITFASITQHRNYDLEAYSTFNNHDTIFIESGIDSSTVFVVVSDSSLIVVDSSAKKRLAELSFKKRLIEKPDINRKKIINVLEGNSFVFKTEMGSQVVSFLDSNRVAVSETNSSYNNLDYYYIENIEGTDLLVIDHGFGLTKMQFTSLTSQNGEGYTFTPFGGGPTQISRMVDVGWNSNFLSGHWIGTNSNDEGKYSDITVTSKNKGKELYFADSSIIYPSSTMYNRAPYKWLKDASLIVTKDDQVWPVKVVNDTTMILYSPSSNLRTMDSKEWTVFKKVDKG